MRPFQDWTERPAAAVVGSNGLKFEENISINIFTTISYDTTLVFILLLMNFIWETLSLGKMECFS